MNLRELRAKQADVHALQRSTQDQAIENGMFVAGLGLVVVGGHRGWSAGGQLAGYGAIEGAATGYQVWQKAGDQAMALEAGAKAGTLAGAAMMVFVGALFVALGAIFAAISGIAYAAQAPAALLATLVSVPILVGCWQAMLWYPYVQIENERVRITGLPDAKMMARYGWVQTQPGVWLNPRIWQEHNMPEPRVPGWFVPQQGPVNVYEHEGEPEPERHLPARVDYPWMGGRPQGSAD